MSSFDLFEEERLARDMIAETEVKEMNSVRGLEMATKNTIRLRMTDRCIKLRVTMLTSIGHCMVNKISFNYCLKNAIMLSDRKVLDCVISKLIQDGDFDLKVLLQYADMFDVEMIEILMKNNIYDARVLSTYRGALADEYFAGVVKDKKIRRAMHHLSWFVKNGKMFEKIINQANYSDRGELISLAFPEALKHGEEFVMEVIMTMSEPLPKVPIDHLSFHYLNRFHPRIIALVLKPILESPEDLDKLYKMMNSDRPILSKWKNVLIAYAAFGFMETEVLMMALGAIGTEV